MKWTQVSLVDLVKEGNTHIIRMPVGRHTVEVKVSPGNMLFSPLVIIRMYREPDDLCSDRTLEISVTTPVGAVTQPMFEALARIEHYAIKYARGDYVAPEESS